MRKYILNLILFIISAICFGIHSKLMYNTGYFCDDYNLSPDIIYGGNFYLMLNWLEWILLAVICLVLLINFILSLVKHKK